MMWPTILILRVGRGQTIPIPLPLFLLWPFIILGWLVYPFLRLVPASSRERGGRAVSAANPGSGKVDRPARPPHPAQTLRVALVAFAKLNGLRIDVRDPEEGRFSIRIY
ncbi:MAG: hypothetical protein GF355_06275 [Candidatus Eisenbacteria bacterium]|nr:hypothetical protein [Candidatus Eisenbacteria bacterium]